MRFGFWGSIFKIKGYNDFVILTIRRTFTIKRDEIKTTLLVTIKTMFIGVIESLTIVKIY